MCSLMYILCKHAFTGFLLHDTSQAPSSRISTCTIFFAPSEKQLLVRLFKVVRRRLSSRSELLTEFYYRIVPGQRMSRRSAMKEQSVAFRGRFRKASALFKVVYLLLVSTFKSLCSDCYSVTIVVYIEPRQILRMVL